MVIMDNCSQRRTIAWTLILVCVSLSGGCAPALMTADDAVVRTDGNVNLRAYLERKTGKVARDSIENHTIRFLVNGQQVGEGRTDENGLATYLYPIGDRPAATFVAETEIDGQTLRDERPIFQLKPGRIGIIVDIDGTVSHTDSMDVVTSKVSRKSRPIDLSPRVVKKLSETYNVAFLSARPRFLLEKSRRWIKEHGYPDVPLYTAPGLRRAMKPGEFKREALKQIRQAFPDVMIGIGDLESDAYAYGANNMLTLIVGQEPDEDFGNHALLLPNWQMLDRFFDANSELLLDPQRLQQTIEQGGVVKVPLSPWREPKD